MLDSLFELLGDLLIGIVLVLLSIVEHNSFFIHDFHVVVGWVGVGGDG